MELPYKPTNVLHKWGGRVVEVTGIKHQTEKPSGGYSRDCWYFTAQIQWDDTGNVKDGYLDPPYMCADTDEGHKEINALMGLMMDYLRQHGEWSDDGKHKGWYAHRKERSTA